MRESCWHKNTLLTKYKMLPERIDENFDKERVRNNSRI